MKYLLLLSASLLLHSTVCTAQQKNNTPKNSAKNATGKPDKTKPALEPIKLSSGNNIQGDGYLVYKNTMIRGKVTLGKNFINLERKVNDSENFVTNMYLTDTALKLVTIYKPGKSPLCLNRVRPNDKSMMRLVHEGKMNIFDDKISSFYDAGNVDKNVIVVTINEVPEDLSSTVPDRTKTKLIERINTTYTMALDAKNMQWPALLKKIERLEIDCHKCPPHL